MWVVFFFNSISCNFNFRYKKKSTFYYRYNENPLSCSHCDGVPTTCSTFYWIQPPVSPINAKIFANTSYYRTLLSAENPIYLNNRLNFTCNIALLNSLSITFHYYVPVCVCMCVCLCVCVCILCILNLLLILYEKTTYYITYLPYRRGIPI